ncbi:hypothetical protein CDD81_2940 [Ophiocordyceps australis]|uniref:Man1/Src1-like C-terminal domain-containing protein n=1 Tax=Ophiocordyceps australis TaxID=1399860 RepID=A0A2C5YJS0_9HYPO|nr:hypothetical protein CDD81_2940 [Ophiocordyceps australis]
MVLGRLASQKEIGQEDLDDPWLFLPNLRDDVLRSVHALSERDKIWQRVRAVVEQNSNVRTCQREGRSGEVGRAWEWIGPIQGEGARRRRSGQALWNNETSADSPQTRARLPRKCQASLDMLLRLVWNLFAFQVKPDEALNWDQAKLNE